MPAKKKSIRKRPRRTRTTPSALEQTRLWLTYPARLIRQPVIWTLGRKFRVVTNIRQVSVTDAIGITCLELDGKREEIKRAIQWLKRQGISVEPVEINVIES
jgi:hypothetical protein